MTGRRRWVRTGRWVVVATIAGTPAVGIANDPPPPGRTSLHWDAPSSCPDGERTLQLARELVLDEDWRLPSTVSASITESATGYVMMLEVRTRHESVTRRLEARDCEALAGAAAVIVALRAEPSPEPIALAEVTTEPKSEARKQDTSTEPIPATPPEAPPRRPARPTVIASMSRTAAPADPSAPPKKKAPELDLGLWAAGGVGLGALPGGSAGGAFGVGLEWRRFAVELGARLWAPRRRSASDGTDRGGAFGLVAGSLRACWLRRFRRVVVPVCGVALAGPMAGVGRGVAIENAQRHVDPWVALAGSSGARIRIVGPLSLRLDAEGLVAVRRPGFELLATGERLHRAASVAVRLWAGVHAHFSLFQKKMPPGK